MPDAKKTSNRLQFDPLAHSLKGLSCSSFTAVVEAVPMFLRCCPQMSLEKSASSWRTNTYVPQISTHFLKNAKSNVYQNNYASSTLQRLVAWAVLTFANPICRGKMPMLSPFPPLFLWQQDVNVIPIPLEW